MVWDSDVTAVVLAHNGGWDEIALVGVPLAVFWLLLMVARKRARSITEKRTDS